MVSFWGVVEETIFPEGAGYEYSWNVKDQGSEIDLVSLVRGRVLILAVNIAPKQ